MRPVLLDTNIVSYIQRNDSRALLYQRHLAGQQLAVAFMTVAELYQWTIVRNWGQARIDDLKRLIGTMVTLPYDDEMGWQWANIMAIKGFPVSPNDAWIAAAAIRYGFPLVTHNRVHFEAIPGLSIISEVI